MDENYKKDEMLEKQCLLQRNPPINYNISPQKDPSLVRTRGKIKGRILKNVLVLGAAFFLFFSGFQGLANLQSTMNSKKGLGMNSQAVIYAVAALSSILFPELLIKKFGCKTTLVICILSGAPYIASNYYPRVETLIPTSVLVGFAIGPLGAAQAFYVNEMSVQYFKASTSETLEAVTAKFFGFFSFFTENTQIWGSFVSYYILRPSMSSVPINSTHPHCGIDFHKDLNTTGNHSNPNLQPPTQDKRFELVTVFVLFAILSSILLGFFVDHLPNDREEGVPTQACKSVFMRLLAAFKHLGNFNQILLVPLTVFCGMEIAFYTSDFTQAYIACSWGVHHVGFVTICFGVCGALMAIMVGPLVKYASQMSVIILAACINVAICCLLFIWNPTPDVTIIYFVFAGVWGMADAIWWSQIAALYGLMFPNDREAAFSNFFFWSNLGFFICYSYANYFTVAVKINILLGMLVLGIIGYLVGQLKLKYSRRNEYVLIIEKE